MNLLFVHQNFPAQFVHLAPAMARLGHQVVALHVNPCPALPGVRTVRYAIDPPQKGAGTHPWLQDLNTKVIRGEAAWRAARRLRDEGFTPDVIVAHPGWGESLFLKEVWPAARLGIYCEFYYQPNGGDVGFDPEFQRDDPGAACRLQMKNANFELHFPMAAAGLAPTQWQASVYPEPFRSRITVMHDGIDTERLRPNPGVRMKLKTRSGENVEVTRDDEVITFVNRNLEPYRGYHVFMRALPRLMRERPKARFMIVGGDEVSYGAAPPPLPSPDGQGPARRQTWKDIFLREVASDLDMSRVHFLGRIPYPRFVELLQLSTVHVYLTYPFVLSWSLLEAMSIGCAIVASDTPPVREAIRHGDTGLMVDFFDRDGLVDSLIRLLEDSAERSRLGAAAREHARATYDLRRICLPGQVGWAMSL
jgi:glycosyltransferase involved in cell wall biosynthesis